MAYPSTAAQIETQIQTLATTFSTLCTRTEFTRRTHDGGTAASPGRKVSFVRIGTGTGEGRPRILITAGVHAREWAPPDAVLTFLTKLLEAYRAKKPMVYKKFVDKRFSPSVLFKEFTIPFADVERIIERTELYVVPLVNPDGRAFTMPPTKVKGWRKNRRPAPSGVTCPPLPPGLSADDRIWVSNDPGGVDLNRNFDIAWDVHTYYSSAAISSGSVAVNDNPCDLQQTFRGPAAKSEPETLNVEELIATKNIVFYMDAHSAAGKFVIPWALARNQTSDNSKTFRNPALDASGGAGGRDPTGASPAYAEWMPSNDEREHRTLGDSMRDAILNSTGYSASAAATDPQAKKARDLSTHDTVQAAFLYSTTGRFYTGTSRDFAFGQRIGATPSPPVTAVARNPVFSYTFECGRDSDGGFQPHATKEYPKIEREVGAALAQFLKFAAAWRAPVPAPAPTPAPPTPPTPAPTPSSDKMCLIATAAYGSPLHPNVHLLRNIRDKELAATPFGRRALRVIERVYYSFSPIVARYLEGHSVLRSSVRIGIVAPLISVIAGSARLVSGVQPQDRRIRCFLGLVGAAAATFVLLAGAAAYVLWRAVAGH